MIRFYNAKGRRIPQVDLAAKNNFEIREINLQTFITFERGIGVTRSASRHPCMHVSTYYVQEGMLTWLNIRIFFEQIKLSASNINN